MRASIQAHYQGARERTSALASVQARESRSARALDYVFYPIFSRPRSPALPRTAGEPWAELGVMCSQRSCMGALLSDETIKSETIFTERAGLSAGIVRQHSLANASGHTRRGGKVLERTAGGEDSRAPTPTHFLPRPPSPSHPLPRHLPRCPAGSPACHGGRGCRAGQGSNAMMSSRTS